MLVSVLTAFEGHHWSSVDIANLTFVATRMLTSHIADKYLLWFVRLLPASSRPRDYNDWKTHRVAGEQDRAASSGSRSPVIPQQEEECAVPRRYGHLPDRWAWWQEGRNNLQFHRLIRSVNVPCRTHASRKRKLPAQARRACFLKVGLQELAIMSTFTHTCDGTHTWKKKSVSFICIRWWLTELLLRREFLDSSPGRLSGLCDFVSW